MQWDNWGLPYLNEDSRSNVMQLLALYFINIHCHKSLIDADFRLKHPPRKRAEDEIVEDYDNYLTQHNNAYRDMLERNNLEYMAEADVHLHDKIAGSTYGKNQLQIHPIAYSRQMDNLNMLPMLAVMLLYGFMDTLKAQTISWLPNYRSLQDGRSNAFLRYAGDLFTLLSVAVRSDKQNIMAQLVVAKDVKPTWISKIATKLFLRNPGTQWPSIVRYLGV